MGDLVSVPLWLFLAISAFALWSLVDRLLIPSGRWFLRRRLNRLIDTVNRKLDVEIKPFQLTKRQVLIDRLVYDPQVVAAANDYARENKIPREAAMNEVYRYAREIVPTFNAYVYFRLGYSIARAVASFLYRVRLGFADERTLAGVAPGTAVVFVMNHRSNMDYVLVAFLAAERTALSYAVGEWARIWPLQQLVRSMGAYFVRRNSNNPVYRRVLGFRRFIVEAETERARFAERAGLFYEYLPYAIVFGETQQWARAFEGLAVPQPGEALHRRLRQSPPEIGPPHVDAAIRRLALGGDQPEGQIGQAVRQRRPVHLGPHRLPGAGVVEQESLRRPRRQAGSEAAQHDARLRQAFQIERLGLARVDLAHLTPPAVAARSARRSASAAHRAVGRPHR